MPVCVVSGASGLVGQAITSRLSASGYDVRAWRATATPAQAHGSIFRLGETSVTDVEHAFAGVDAFVHCAWDLRVARWRDIERVNARGSIAWFEAAARAGVPRLVFISSVSAYPHCRSMYGRSKLLVEDAVTRLHGVNLRPGIVHGDPSAGVYGRLWQSTDASRIPLIDGGTQRMLTVHRDDLARVVESVIANYPRWQNRTVVVGHPELVTLRGMLERIARARGRRARFVNVPGSMVMLALRGVEATGLRLPFRSDSLLTLMGDEPVVDSAALRDLDVPLRSLDEALANAPRM